MPPFQLNQQELTKLTDDIFNAAKTSLGSDFKKVKVFLKTESEKLAVTLRMIIEAKVNGTINESEARILLNMQKIATQAVLTSAKGMSVLAAENAINSALDVVKSFVNGKLGFTLL